MFLRNKFEVKNFKHPKNGKNFLKFFFVSTNLKLTLIKKNKIRIAYLCKNVLFNMTRITNVFTI